MSERNVRHENFHTKHSVFIAPDAHMHTSVINELYRERERERERDRDRDRDRDRERDRERERENSNSKT